jgi:sugar lactone lactonase YvrE
MTISGYTTSFILFISAAMILGCSKTDNSPRIESLSKKDIPEHIRNLDSLTVYSQYAPARDTVEFEKAQVFESNEEVYIDGYVGEAIADGQGRVYIGASVAGSAKIYVFQPDGSYITTIGRPGRGPGEFVAISEMGILGNQLFLYDPIQYKISVFSLEDFSHIKDMIINREKIKGDKELAPLSAKGPLFILKDTTFIMGFIGADTELHEMNKYRNTLYYKLSSDAAIQAGKVMDLERMLYYMPDSPGSKGRLQVPEAMPFSRSSLIDVSRDHIYTAWTERFLIKVHDRDGNYQRAIYYPYSNSPFSVDDTELDERRLELIDENEDQVPESWPALHNMVVDDEGRLWVLTITDSGSSYNGWVLDTNGTLLARFSWPGQRVSRYPRIQPQFYIKNDYLYTKEQDIGKGIDRIVKHKIIFK